MMAVLSLLCKLRLKVLSAEFDEVLRVGSNDLLAEVLQDLWELFGNHDLVGTEDAHLSDICHCFLFFI